MNHKLNLIGTPPMTQTNKTCCEQCDTTGNCYKCICHPQDSAKGCKHPTTIEKCPDCGKEWRWDTIAGEMPSDPLETIKAKIKRNDNPVLLPGLIYALTVLENA